MDEFIKIWGLGVLNLVEQIRQRAYEQPNQVALHFRGKDITYSQFEKLVGIFTFALQQLGVKKGDHIAVVLGNTPEFLISIYATMRIGAVAIPINPFYTKSEISYILEDSDAKFVIANDTLLPLIETDLQKEFPEIATYIICETKPDRQQEKVPLSVSENKTVFFTHLLESTTSSLEPIEISQEDTAIILYTSGTTGRPKGAMLSHLNLYANARDVANYFLFTEADRVVATLPLFHVFGLTVVINAPLFKGSTILLAPRFNPSEIHELAREQEATVFAGVPTMLNFLNQYSNGNPKDFSSLRLVVSGGAPLPATVLHNFEGKFGIQVSEGYGLSEASPVTCFNPLSRERKVGSIGMSIPNVKNKVVDNNGVEVPLGEVGELIVHGPNVMKGYYKMPKETSETIRDGWLYTGDLAKKDEEDYFYIVDRKKDLIIVGGFNVYPREVEEVLYLHPNVVEAAVVGAHDPDFGEIVYAYVVLRDKEAPIEELQHFCAERLARYKLPEIIEVMDELPKNSTGKILRKFLKEKHAVN